MKCVQLEPTLKNQSNDAYINCNFVTTLVSARTLNLDHIATSARVDDQQINAETASITVAH